MTCPKCHGKGTEWGFACPGFSAHEFPCFCCNGSGNISADQAERMVEGEGARKARIQRRVSLREEATRLGVKPSDLSMWEVFGRALPSPHNEGKAND
jgi:hypothetical protein